MHSYANPQHRHSSRSSAAATQRLTLLELILLVLLAAAVAYAALADPFPPTAPTDIPTSTVRVRASETLWAVALRHPVEGLDTRQTVRVIQELNDMSGSKLAVGQLLVVPAGVSASTALATRD